MSEHKFRIEIKGSRYRKGALGVLLVLFLVSVWMWQTQIIPWQLLIQLLLTLVLLLWFSLQIFRNEHKKVLLLTETGQITWLQPLDETPWEIAQQSRFNGFLHWLVLKNELLQKQQRLLVFRDSVSDSNWRHLCRIVSKK